MNTLSPRKVVFAIQARLGSTRLPQKALRDLVGKPILKNIFDNLKHSFPSAIFFLTTSDAMEDDKLVNAVKIWGVPSSRAPVDDIITRLHRTLEDSAADTLVRIWGDCPFVCADIVDKMLTLFADNNLDYISNCDRLLRTLPTGVDLEIYSKNLLGALTTSVKDLKLREFPMEYIRKHVPTNKKMHYAPQNKLNGFHLTIDYPEDLKAAEDIYFELKKENKIPFYFKDLEDLFQLKPTLFSAFSNQQRNIEYNNFLAQKKDETQ